MCVRRAVSDAQTAKKKQINLSGSLEINNGPAGEVRERAFSWWDGLKTKTTKQEKENTSTTAVSSDVQHQKQRARANGLYAVSS